MAQYEKQMEEGKWEQKKDKIWRINRREKEVVMRLEKE
jgi:hypothetical protein